MQQETKQCQNCKKEFIIEPDDFQFYEKMKVTAPIFCPDCRQEHRLLFRNFKTLYKVNSAKSGKSVISMYSSDSPYILYNNDEWWSDDWDAKSYGRDFDFSRPFFDQLNDLYRVVPHYALMNGGSDNCEYSNMTWRSKNCYLIFGCIDDENCDYGHILWNSRDCTDCLYLFKSELCYESIDCINCNKLLYSQDCESCSDSIGLFDCRSCNNCIGCVNLQQKSYYIFNKPSTKEEYNNFLKENPLSDPNTIKKILEGREAIRLKLPHRFYFGSRNNNVSGNYITNSKNVHYAFDIKAGEDSKFGFTVRTFKDSYDVSFNPDIESSYQVMACGGSNNAVVCHLCNSCSYAYYSEHCYNSHNIFGCQGLKSGEYCILNKQYSKEEYEVLKEKIIEHMKKTGEWGQWFPLKMSPFAYNESIVNEYSPLKKEEALIKGYRWKDDLPSTVGQETISNDALPKDPAEYTDNLIKQVLKCDKCGRNFRLISREIAHYKKLLLPLPRFCPNCRHDRRMSLRLPRKLWHRSCMCDKKHMHHTGECANEFETSYAPERPEIVYCEQCYQQETV
jgi:DNA-directed RNA polymerase subunit RPC12/RpoP